MLSEPKLCRGCYSYTCHCCEKCHRFPCECQVGKSKYESFRKMNQQDVNQEDVLCYGCYSYTCHCCDACNVFPCECKKEIKGENQGIRRRKYRVGVRSFYR